MRSSALYSRYSRVFLLWAPERLSVGCFFKKSWNHTCSLHLHIFSSSHFHIFTSSHLHILHFSHCAVPTSNFYFAVLSRSHLAWRSKRLAPGHGAWGGSKMPTLKKARSQWDGQGWGITENWWLYVGFITECTADVTGKPDAIQYFKVNPWLEAGMRWAPILGIRPNPLNALYIYICMPWVRQVCRTRMEWTLADRMGTCAGGLNNWSKFQKQQEGNIMLANQPSLMGHGDRYI